jgi:hypothetical protein
MYSGMDAMAKCLVSLCFTNFKSRRSISVALTADRRFFTGTNGFGHSSHSVLHEQTCLCKSLRFRLCHWPGTGSRRRSSQKP